MLKIGSHVSMNGPKMLVGSVEEALSYEATTFMIYTGAPQNTRRKPVDEMKIEEAQALMASSGINKEDVVVHAPYIMNLANPDETKQSFAIDFLTEEIKRTDKMGFKQIVLHPGAHVNQGSETGIKRIVSGLNQVIENTKESDVLIALETMSGKGTEVGRTFEELKAIIDGVLHDERLSVCLDTCHIHDAGYDIINDYDGVLKQFDEVVGLDRLSVLHINDSKNPTGAHKDRHENYGFGYIGFDTLSKFIYDERFDDLPKVLETPYLPKSDEDKKRIYPPYKYEIDMIRSKRFNPNLKTIIRQKENDVQS